MFLRMFIELCLLDKWCFKKDTDYYGGDFRSEYTNTADDCQSLCKEDDHCVAFTWIDIDVSEGPLIPWAGKCHLKRKYRHGTYLPHVISGPKYCGKFLF